jgi:magnesium-transporting ATPase (P-type)
VYRSPASHSRNLSDLSNLSSVSEGDIDSPPLHPIAGFFNVLALCHSVLASVDPQTDRVEYKAQSPDEAALVQAAADAGFVFRGRDKEVLKLQTPFAEGGSSSAADANRPSSSSSSASPQKSTTAPNIEEYELLNLLDFTSARKRMSVLVRRRNGRDRRILLLTKGADNVIFERLKPGENDALKETTGKHLDEFAGEGLRTLTLAYKFVSGECLRLVFEAWLALCGMLCGMLLVTAGQRGRRQLSRQTRFLIDVSYEYGILTSISFHFIILPSHFTQTISTTPGTTGTKKRRSRWTTATARSKPFRTRWSGI